MTKVEAGYRACRLRNVLAVDFGSKGDLYVRFNHAPHSCASWNARQFVSFDARPMIEQSMVESGNR